MGLKLAIVVGLAIVLGAFGWYVMWSLQQAIEVSGAQMLIDAGTNSSTSDQIQMFFSGLASYGLIVAIIIIGYYAWVHSQERGVPIYE